MVGKFTKIEKWVSDYLKYGYYIFLGIALYQIFRIFNYGYSSLESLFNFIFSLKWVTVPLEYVRTLFDYLTGNKAADLNFFYPSALEADNLIKKNEDAFATRIDSDMKYLGEQADEVVRLLNEHMTNHRYSFATAELRQKMKKVVDDHIRVGSSKEVALPHLTEAATKTLRELKTKFTSESRIYFWITSGNVGEYYYTAFYQCASALIHARSLILQGSKGVGNPHDNTDAESHLTSDPSRYFQY